MIRELLSQPSSGISDPNAKYVSLLLNGDGTNGAQNQTFVDSSVNNATITRYGGATQGSFSPFGNSWSNYFDGTGDYLSLPSSTNYTLDGDFTLEYWVNQTGTPVNYLCHFIMQTSSGNTLHTHTTSNGKLCWGVNGDVSLSGIGPNLFDTGWHHISVCRSGGVSKLFVDGLQVDSYSNSGTITGTNIYISYWSGARYIQGNISNLRLVKGTALYTSNFTPSTTPLTAVTGTVLLTCNSNSFKDNSVNNAAISVFGDTKVVKDSPFPEIYDKNVQGGSAYFDGTGDYLSLPNSTSYQILGSAFTVEFWVNFNSAWTSKGLVGIHNSSNDGWFLRTTATALRVYTAGGTADITTSFTLNTWYHIAWVSTGSSSKVYINGVDTGTTVTTGGTNNTANLLQIGQTTTIGDFLNGYISNLRITKGTALYISNFTPPAAPLTAIANTSLLLKCDNAGIVDATGKNDLVTYGSAQISTDQKKYGTGSMYFDGTGDYLTLPYSPTVSASGGNFTIEAWMNPTVTPTTNVIIGLGTINSADNTSYWVEFVGGKLRFYIGISTTLAYIEAPTALTLNQFSHIACVINSGTAYLYVNGTSVGTPITASGVNTGSTTVFTVGAANSGSYAFTGYIDDLRITKGVARYTTNFTPPTSALTL